jgi:hypothetical protein
MELELVGRTAAVKAPRLATAPHHKVRGERRGEEGDDEASSEDGRRCAAESEREKGEDAVTWDGVREEGPRVRRGRGGA